MQHCNNMILIRLNYTTQNKTSECRLQGIQPLDISLLRNNAIISRHHEQSIKFTTGCRSSEEVDGIRRYVADTVDSGNRTEAEEAQQAEEWLSVATTEYRP